MRISSHCALLSASPQGLWDLSGRGNFQPWSPNPVAVEQPQGFVQPLPTPPLPAKALSFLSPPYMAPDLLFYPVFDEVEALAGMSDREVVHPTAQHRVDQLHYTIYLAPVISRRDEEGFSSCLACPCHRAVASTPPRSRCRVGQISAPHAAFALQLRARPSGSLIFEATFAFTFVTAR